jgi:hypothetical protein
MTVSEQTDALLTRIAKSINPAILPPAAEVFFITAQIIIPRHFISKHGQTALI